MIRNSNLIKKIVLISFLFSLVSFVPLAYVNASDFGTGNLGKAVGASYGGKTDLGASIGSIISGVLALAGTIFLILTVYGGITWMIAMGNQEKIEKAKNIITAAVIGGAITGGAYAITFFVMGRIASGGGGSPTTGTGNESNKICCCLIADDKDTCNFITASAGETCGDYDHETGGSGDCE
ncbi:MAG: cbb3-type cytochrome c oxidase subunit 3 [Candidatus Omnitrophota bacterium]